MMRYPRLLLVTALLLAGAALAALPGADVEENRKLLRDWQVNQPDEYARIRRNYERFHSLPPKKVERIRELDRDLHKNAETQEKLGHVLEDYAAWLTRLPAGDRERIHAAATKDDKLRIIRELKEREWLDQLPRTYRAQYAAAKTEKEKQDLTRKWRQLERDFDDQWAESNFFWGGAPSKRPAFQFAPQAFWKELFDFIRVKLYPMLDNDERARLEKTIQDFEQGNHPGNSFGLLKVIAELSDRHPVLSLQPKYTNLKSLPPEYQRAIERMPKFAMRNLRENRWPQYPIEVTYMLRKAKSLPQQQLGPANAREISEAVDKWVQKDLWPKLSGPEKGRLRGAEGKWPDYPLALHDVAKAHRMSVPEMSLPGDPRLWENLTKRPMMGPPGRPK